MVHYHWVRPWIKTIAAGLLCLLFSGAVHEMLSTLGSLLICFGITSNILVILANDNKMPMQMSPEKFAERSRPDCICANDATKFSLLIDRFKVGAINHPAMIDGATLKS